MKMGFGAMQQPFGRSLRLVCVAALVLSGMMARVDPLVSGDEIVVKVGDPPVEKRSESHHHHVESHNKHQQQHHHHEIKASHHDHHRSLDAGEKKKQQHHHHHVKDVVEKIKARVVAMNSNHHRNKHYHHHNRGKGKHHHRKKKDKNKGVGGDDGKPRVASFGILVCDNRTISTVFCPTGTQKRPGVQMMELMNVNTFTAQNNGGGGGGGNCSKSIGYLDVITMVASCPKPAKKDIVAAIRRLTRKDRERLRPFFNFGFYSTAISSLPAIDRHNGGDDSDCDGYWHDKCTGVGTFCGIDIFGCSTIDDGLYSCCAVGDKPKLIELCPLGGCVGRVEGNNGTSSCRHNECKCVGSGQHPHCGREVQDWQLPPRIEHVSKSSRAGQMSMHKAWSVCPKGAGACEPNPCVCSNTQSVICGSTFPSKCRFKSTYLYSCCGENTKPRELIECVSGSCPPGATKCDPGPCDCQKTGDICGATFPKTCTNISRSDLYTSGSLYECKREGDTPSVIERCLSGTCVKGTGNCSPNECACKKTGFSCGSEFPDICGLDPASRYRCNGEGRTPLFEIKCPTNYCPADGDGACEKNVCLCEKAGKVCAESFDSNCTYPKGALMNCEKEGATPIVQHNCSSGQCDATTNTCVPDECDCTKAGDICGATFPSKCALNKKVLYKCTGAGEEPVEIMVCKSGECPAGETKCKDDECDCDVKGDICSSAFQLVCNYPQDTLFQCVIGEKPVVYKKCMPGTCPISGKSCDEVDLDCLCTTKGNFCGSEFDKSCKKDANNLYYCLNVGDDPKILEPCLSGVCLPDKHACKEYPCSCPENTTTICGSSFPDECNFDPGSVYGCSSRATLPIRIKECETKECPVNATDCTPPPDLCDCEGNEQICGSTFDPACNKQVDSMYYCSEKGKDPVLIEECVAGSCHAGEHTCVRPLECKCKGPGHPCGSDFPAKCELEADWKYQCGEKGDDPKKWLCQEAGKCNQTIDPYDGLDPCACSSTGIGCGSILGMANCKRLTILLNAIYECVDGKDPILQKECVSPETCVQLSTGGVCKDVPDLCKCNEGVKVCGKDLPNSCGVDKRSANTCKDGKWAEKENCDLGCKSFEGKCLSKCDCEANGLVCGRRFDPKICNFPPAKLFSCRKDRPPRPLRDCAPATCQMNPLEGSPSVGAFSSEFSMFAAGDYNDTCALNPCYCKAGDTLVCGSSFNETCGLPKTSVLSCPGNGGLPVEVEKCSVAGCVAENGGAKCKPDPCLCSDKGTYCGFKFPMVCKIPSNTLQYCSGKDKEPLRICGSSFPTKCSYKKDTLYACGDKGTEPTELGPCLSGSCPKDSDKCAPMDKCNCDKIGKEAIYECSAANGKPVKVEDCPSKSCPSGTDKCAEIDKCDCAKTGQMCGSEFDKSSPKVRPVFVNNCPSKDCPANATECKPAPDLCLCKANEQICGSTFDISCRKIQRDSMYYCEKKGDEPSLIERCIDGTCKPGEHNCPCGGDFPEKCNFDKDWKYQCGEAGDDPKKWLHARPGQCKPTIDPIDGLDPCLCSGTGIGCGSILGMGDCKRLSIRGNTIYKCACGKDLDVKCGVDDNSAVACKGGKWEEYETCERGCRSIESQCISKCDCEVNGLVCGEHLPIGCALTTGVLYSCIKDRKPVTVRDCAPGSCKQNPLQSAQVKIRAFSSDFSKFAAGDYNDTCAPNPCYCKANETLVCSDKFDVACKFKENVILSCPGTGGRPVEIKECGSGGCEAKDGGATCKPDPCRCPAKGVICSSEFPKECSYAADTVLTCPTTGGDPVVAEACAPDKCVMTENGGRCDKNTCLCKGKVDRLCASDFGSKCAYDEDKIYKCDDVNLPPIVIETCPAEFSCAHENNDVTCHADKCHCQADATFNTTVCGRDLPKDCGYDGDTLFRCAIVGEEWEKCSDDDCRCTKHDEAKELCGSNFPPGCKVEQNSKYTCTAGELPTKIGSCPLGSKCGGEWASECRFEQNTIIECSPGKAEPKKGDSCLPDKCVQEGREAKCRADPCKCNDGDLTCGSNIPEICSKNDKTIYECKSGAWQQKTECGTRCTTTSNPQCVPGPCDCQAKDLLGFDECGVYKNTPRNCGFANESIYTCSAIGEKPKVKEDCAAQGKVCDLNLFTKEVTCKEMNCKCEGGKPEMCAMEFSRGCGFPLTSLYSCADPNNPKEIEKCDIKCVISLTEPSKCLVDPCHCKKGLTKMCGNQFDNATACGLFDNRVYDCTDPKSPKSIEDCHPTACLPTPEAHCDINLCACTDGETKVCGKNFDDKCGFDDEAIYTCAGKNNAVKDKDCKPLGLCETENSIADCKPDACVCQPGVQSTCAKDLPGRCGFTNSKQIASCTQQGSSFTPGPVCTTECEANVPGVSARCKVEHCKCKDFHKGHNVCASQFLATCTELLPNKLYFCANVGDEPIEIEDCQLPKKCIVNLDEGKCVIPILPCKCPPGKDSICGSVFEDICNKDKNTVYNCAGREGDDPLELQKCAPQACISGDTTAKCEVNYLSNLKNAYLEAASQDRRNVLKIHANTCGSDYDPSCTAIDKGYIYTCSGKNADPVKGDKCDHGCFAKDGTAVCLPDCTCKDNKDICGSSFPPGGFPTGCGLDPDTLYRCPTPGLLPSPHEKCKPDMCKTDTSKCFVDECACKSIGTLCGKDICPGLERDMVYACNAMGDTATPMNQCPPLKCNGGRCDAKDCVCTVDGPFCGADLPCPGLDKDIYYFECGYEQNQVLTCPGGRGTEPVFKQQCGVGRCDLSAIKCDLSCKCPDDKAVCGKQFDPGCNFDGGTIFACASKGSTPIPGKKCGGPELCDATSGVGRCLGECKCKSYELACGAAFPASCNFQPGSLYSCDYAGADPVRPQTCKVPCNPQNGPDRCGVSVMSV
ncbi:hypothetical protein BGZ83_005954 [Gryganskiella cystojenkinii]|nr:hypothetical protein BGZ83_005954 [Gryganskiella cystojenkinii]